MIDDERGPWGIVVTGTLHLCLPGSIDPACGRSDVQSLISEQIARYRDGSDPRPVYGHAEQRPVCNHCLRSLDRVAETMRVEMADARAWNAQR